MKAAIRKMIEERKAAAMREPPHAIRDREEPNERRLEEPMPWVYPEVSLIRSVALAEVAKWR